MPMPEAPYAKQLESGISESIADLIREFDKKGKAVPQYPQYQFLLPRQLRQTKYLLQLAKQVKW